MGCLNKQQTAFHTNTITRPTSWRQLRHLSASFPLHSRLIPSQTKTEGANCFLATPSWRFASARQSLLRQFASLSLVVRSAPQKTKNTWQQFNRWISLKYVRPSCTREIWNCASCAAPRSDDLPATSKPWFRWTCYYFAWSSALSN